MIENHEINGDVSVTRNVATGGNAKVQGSMRVKHNVIVEGWLEAPNIKSSNKGCFIDETSLCEAYPHPESGWFALVGNSLPAPLYIAFDGKWKPTGQSAGEITIDMQQYEDALESVNLELKGLSDGLKGLSDGLNDLSDGLNDLASKLTVLKASVEANTAGVSRINQKRGEVDGFAPLNNYGELPLNYLPAAIMNVCTFAGVRDTAPAPGDINTTDTPANGNIFFCKDTGRFLCYSSASGVWYTKLYASASPLFGTPETDSDKPGIAPRFHRLYLNALNRSLYMTLDGTDLVQITEPPKTAESNAYMAQNSNADDSDE